MKLNQLDTQRLECRYMVDPTSFDKLVAGITQAGLKPHTPNGKPDILVQTFYFGQNGQMPDTLMRLRLYDGIPGGQSMHLDPQATGTLEIKSSPDLPDVWKAREKIGTGVVLGGISEPRTMYARIAAARSRPNDNIIPEHTFDQFLTTIEPHKPLHLILATQVTRRHFVQEQYGVRLTVDLPHTYYGFMPPALTGQVMGFEPNIRLEVKAANPDGLFHVISALQPFNPNPTDSRKGHVQRLYDEFLK